MHLRRPRFGVVLVAILLPVVVVLLVLRGATHSRPSPPPSFIGSGPGRACATATARAAVTAQAPVRATRRGTLPRTVTEQATGKRGTVVVSRSENIVEEATASRLASVRQLSTTRARRCARASTTDAAHGAAFNAAYAVALRRARS